MKNTIIKKTFDINYSLDYLVIVPKMRVDLLDAFTYTFGNTFLFDNTVEELEYLTKFLRKNRVSQLIFVDYYAEYDEVINALVEEHEIKFIFTGGLGELSKTEVLDAFNIICDKYDKKAINEIGFLDPHLFRVIHSKRRNTKQVMLDFASVKKNKSEEKNCIGFLNSDSSNYSSFYNELSSMVFLDGYRAKLLKPIDVVKDFVEEYNIKAKFVNNYNELIGGNICNLDINFVGINLKNFIESMDLNIPCIIGNNGILRGYNKLEKYLAMKSDDNIDEIAEKIKVAVEHKDEILEAYKVFRKDYSKKVAKLADEFVGGGLRINKENEYEKMLTVIIPVYNTESYLAKCLDSVINASISDMEILIINDGSTDGSEKIIKKYLSEYPELIRYIRQKNSGLGHVRNVGLNEAKGKYLASVDSDDTIHPDFFKTALPYFKKDVDVIICDWMSVSAEDSFETPALDWVFRNRKIIDGLLYTSIMPSTCNKIFKKELFEYDNIKYLEQKYEDLSANPLILLEAESIKYIHKPYYNYYLSSNSLMRSKIDSKDMVDAIRYLDVSLKRIKFFVNIDEFKYFTYSWRIEEYIINPLYELENKELDKAVNYIYKYSYEIILDVFETNYYKEMLEGLESDGLRAYIMERNKAFKQKKLEEFIRNNKRNQKLTAGIIYYGG